MRKFVQAQVRIPVKATVVIIKANKTGCKLFIIFHYLDSISTMWKFRTSINRMYVFRNATVVAIYALKGGRCIYSCDFGLEGNFVSQEKETVSDSTFHFSYTMKY